MRLLVACNPVIAVSFAGVAFQRALRTAKSPIPSCSFPSQVLLRAVRRGVTQANIPQPPFLKNSLCLTSHEVECPRDKPSSPLANTLPNSTRALALPFQQDTHFIIRNPAFANHRPRGGP